MSQTADGGLDDVEALLREGASEVRFIPSRGTNLVALLTFGRGEERVIYRGSGQTAALALFEAVRCALREKAT